MDIRKKLEYYRQAPRPADRESVPKEPAQVDTSLKVLQESLDGQILEAQAPFLKIERPYDGLHPGYVPDHLRLDLLTKRSIAQQIDPNECLFFDLETTGLAGGAGTFAFLIGFGYFQDGEYRVTQFFLPDYSREYYLFKSLVPFFRRFKYLVSYNGKSYDLPLLRNRFILNRVDFQMDQLQHIDLLHLSRRIWKDTLPSCDLINIERHLLQRFRENDIPGAFIPQAYFNYLQTGAIHDIKRLIEHNYLDIISMADLILLLNKIELSPEILTDSRSLVRLAGLAYELGREDYLAAIEKAVEAQGGTVPEDVIFYKSMLHKRLEKWPLALELWEELADSRRFWYLALEEMAKYQEHVARDYSSALESTQRVLKRLRLLQELNPYSVDSALVQAFLHREKRLLAKIS